MNFARSTACRSWCSIARECASQKQCTIPSHKLFPQLANIIHLYLEKKVEAQPPSDKKEFFLAPYYGWVVERSLEAILPDTTQGKAPEIPRYEATRGPGSTGEVDFWTSRDVREANMSHLNYVVADTKQWEQSATYYLDKDRAVEAFVKILGSGSRFHTCTMGRRTTTCLISSFGLLINLLVT